MSPSSQLSHIVSVYTVVVLCGSGSCLKIVGVVIPSLADLRQPVSLGCSYDAEQDALFSVKWYKDDQEFYRYMPTHKPSVITFPLTGAFLEQGSTNEDLDCDRNQCSIRLVQLTSAASGAYTCEVSTEAPTFRTAIETKNMTVMALPVEKPRIEGLRSTYTLGEQLDVRCRTAPSAPPALPSFSINNIEMEEKYVTRTIEPSADEKDTFTSGARLRVVLSRAHFVGSLLRVRCSATLASIPATARAADVTATLAAPQPLRNQKLEWPSAAGQRPRSSFVVIALTFLIIARLLSQH